MIFKQKYNQMNMKKMNGMNENKKTTRVRILTMLLLLSAVSGAGAFSLPSDKIRATEEKRELYQDKKTVSEESFLWEKQKSATEKDPVVSDDDTKLSAPPPGEDGNPQKIVPVPLDGPEVPVFLLLSAFLAGYYRKKHRL